MFEDLTAEDKVAKREDKPSDVQVKVLEQLLEELKKKSE